jgi:hypothetical protein
LSAQVWLAPTETWLAPVSPGTRVGAARSVVVPSPSMPYALSPQHSTRRAVVTAQLCVVPPEIEITSPRTGIAAGTLIAPPDPTWELVLWPHPTRPPVDRSAKVWDSPEVRNAIDERSQVPGVVRPQVSPSAHGMRQPPQWLALRWVSTSQPLSKRPSQSA